MKKVSLLVCLLVFLWNGCVSPVTTVSQKIRLDLTLDQTRDVAKTIQVRNVTFWTESNVPWWPLTTAYSSEFFYNPPEEPKGRHLRPGPADETMLSLLMRTMEAWLPISGTAIITSKHGAAIDQTYPAIVAAFPEIKITGGLKMWPYMPEGKGYPLYGRDVGYDWMSDIKNWEQFAVDARRIVKMTGVPSIVIMAEGPMRNFYAGWHDKDNIKHRWIPDYANFHKAMAPLRALSKDGIKITWYPFGTHQGPTMEEGEALVRAIREAVPESWFTTVGDGFPRSENNPEENRRREAMRVVSGDRLHHHIFVTGTGHWTWQNGNTRTCYTPPSLQRWLRDRSFVDDVWVYPGGYSKLYTGEQFYELLIPEAFRPSEIPPKKDDGEIEPPKKKEGEIEPPKKKEGEIEPPKKKEGEIEPPKKDGSLGGDSSLGGT